MTALWRMMRISRRSFNLSLAGLAALGIPTVAGCGAEAEDTAAAASGATTGKHVVVIGAGIAGLAAAAILKKAGCKVTILERERRVGGRLHSVDVPGLKVPDPLDPSRRINKTQDLGAQFFHDRYGTMLRILGDINARKLLAPIQNDYAVKKGDDYFFISPTDANTIYESGLLGTLESLSVKVAYDRVVSDVRNFPLDDHSLWARFEEGTTAEWLEERYGREGANYLGYPAIETLFFYRPEDVSKAIFYWIIANSDQSREWYTSLGSNGRIASILAAHLKRLGVDIHLGKEVKTVSRTSKGAHIVLSSNDKIEADGVILTTPSPISARILTTPTEEQRPILSNAYASTIVVNFHCRDQFRMTMQGDPDFYPYVCNIPRAERASGGAIAGFSIESGKYSREGRAAMNGHDVYGLHLTDGGAKALMGKSDSAVFGAVASELSGYNRHILDKKESQVLQRWEHAIPMSPSGRSRRLYALWSAQKSDDSRILLAGDQTTFATMDAAARSGELAAQALVNKLSDGA